MKKLIYSLTIITLFASAAVSADEKTALAVPPKRDFSNVKIGVMDPYGVLDKSNEWMAQADIIKSDIEKRAKNIQAMEADKQKKQAELKNMGNAATESAKENKQKELMSLENNIMIEQRAAQEIPQQRAQMAQMEILKKIEAASQKIAKEYNLDIVFAGSTIFVAERVDITQMVVDELNKGYKPAPKPATPVKPAAAATPAKP